MSKISRVCVRETLLKEMLMKQVFHLGYAWNLVNHQHQTPILSSLTTFPTLHINTGENVKTSPRNPGRTTVVAHLLGGFLIGLRRVDLGIWSNKGGSHPLEPRKNKQKSMKSWLYTVVSMRFP